MSEKYLMIGTILAWGLAGIFHPAHSRAENLSMALDVTMNSPNGELSDRYSSKFGTGLSMIYLYTEYMGMRAAVHYHTFQRSGDGEDLRLLHGTIDGLFRYPFLRKWHVFIAGGMGIYGWHTDHCWWKTNENEEGGDLGFNYGIGLDYTLTDGINVETSLFQHRVELRDNDRAFRWIEFAMGVRFNLFTNVNR